MDDIATPGIMPLLIRLLPLVASILVLLFWRSRRFPCPESCRACGYDVSRRQSDSTRCSECGADLAGRGAIVTSRNARQPAHVILALLLVVTSAVWYAAGVGKFSFRGWYFERAPDSWVAWDAEHFHFNGTIGGTARYEWLARYRRRALSSSDESRFFDYVLAWQADTKRKWDPQIGDLLNEAAQNKKLSSAQADRFIHNMFQNVQFKVRPSIRLGDDVPFSYSATYRGRSGGVLATLAKTASFNGPPEVPANNTPGWYYRGWDGAPLTRTTTPRETGINALSSGVHKLDIVLAISLTDTNNPQTSLTPTIVFRGSSEVEILALGSPVGTAFQNAANADAVARAMRVGIYHSVVEGRIFAEVQLQPAPVDRSFDVYVEHDGARHLIAHRFAKANATSDSEPLVFIPVKYSPDIKALTLVLVGSGEPLMESVDQKNYWAGTITFPEIPVHPMSGARHGNPLPAYRVTPGENADATTQPSTR